MSLEKEIGRVIHYFSKIGVAVIELKDSLRVGEQIKIRGRGREFSQVVESMEVDHKKINEAKPGEKVGLKVVQKVKEGDLVYKIEE